MPGSINTFIVYAREDKEIKNRLLVHLNPLIKSYNLVIWHDDHLQAGQEWKPHIESRLEQTELFLLLVSVDFMNSEFINQVEFKFAIDRHKANKSIVIPIIINYCQWDIDFNFGDYNFNLNELQVLPQQGMPIDDWKTPEQAYNNIAAGIRKVLETIKAKHLAIEKQKSETDGTENKIKEKIIIPPELPNPPVFEIDRKEAEAKRRVEEDKKLKEETEVKRKVEEEQRQNKEFEARKKAEELVASKILEEKENQKIFESARFENISTSETIKKSISKKYALFGGIVILVGLGIWGIMSLGSGDSQDSRLETSGDSVKHVSSGSIDTNIKLDTAQIIHTPKSNTATVNKAGKVKQKDGTPIIEKASDPLIKTEPIAEVEDENKIFSKVEIEATFPGGEIGWLNYLQKNLNANIAIDNGAKKGMYSVIVKFTVKKDGSLSDITCENDPGYGMCNEAIRVIKKGPKWNPSTQNGRYVNAYRRQPVSFLVE